MLKVGITGGIGSGKSVVCQVFHTLGIPVFYADEAARYLMEHNTALIENISALLGKDVYVRGKLDRSKVSARIYGNPALLQQMNALVHPATIAYARSWMEEQYTPYAIKEAAIFFESNTNVDMDVMVGVYAPVETRIKRAMDRGALTREKVQSIMREQMDDEEKMKRCDHIVVNDDKTAILPQVIRLDALFRSEQL